MNCRPDKRSAIRQNNVKGITMQRDAGSGSEPPRGRRNRLARATRLNGKLNNVRTARWLQ